MLNEFVSLLCGEFDNLEQFEKSNLPYCRHINTVINDKMNLASDFKGVFMLEESYYTSNGNTHATPHLFLFTEVEGKIRLESFEIPSGFDKNTFNASNVKSLKVEDLVKSAKFTDAYYEYHDGAFSGGSISMFSPTLKFTLKETFSKDYLEVEESMEVNGKKTFGFDEPIIYKRVTK